MSAPQSWIDACIDHARAHGLEGEALERLAVLRAFRSPDPRGGPPPPAEALAPEGFAAFETLALAWSGWPALAAALEADVDPDQAQLFTRRVAAVDEGLARAPGALPRVLRVGLRVRLKNMLAAPGPRALRVRALADFYYSQLGRERCRRASAAAPSLAQRVAAATWRVLGPGLEHAHVEGPSAEGPLHLNLLRADPSRVRVEAHDCRPALARARDLGHRWGFPDFVAEQGASAAVSGGFFLYSEPDIEDPAARYDPVGLLMMGGQLLSPPVFRRGSVLVTQDAQHGQHAQRVEIAALGPEALTLTVAGHPLPARGALNRARARRGPDRESIAIVGDRVLARGRALPVPLNGLVLPLPEHPPADVLAHLRPGARLDFGEITTPGGGRLHAGIAGGPMLVEDGVARLDMRGEDFWGSAPPVTFSQDETGDHNQLPRLAAGLDGQGRLLFAAVDGRNFERALGMTLAQLGALMLALGCERATNLDGGSSKRMVVDGRAVDLTSTEILSEGARAPRVRPVHTALLLSCGDNQ